MRAFMMLLAVTLACSTVSVAAHADRRDDRGRGRDDHHVDHRRGGGGPYYGPPPVVYGYGATAYPPPGIGINLPGVNINIP